MSEEVGIYMVNGQNQPGYSSDKNTLWIAGWMWGKYPEQAQTYPLPQDESDAAQWLQGFRWGATEACQFHRLWEWLDETLAGHDTTIQLVNKVAGNV
jgi:hypothetical protein